MSSCVSKIEEIGKCLLELVAVEGIEKELDDLLSVVKSRVEESKRQNSIMEWCYRRSLREKIEKAVAQERFCDVCLDDYRVQDIEKALASLGFKYYGTWYPEYHESKTSTIFNKRLDLYVDKDGYIIEGDAESEDNQLYRFVSIKVTGSNGSICLCDLDTFPLADSYSTGDDD